jgi:hypothetical protein
MYLKVASEGLEPPTLGSEDRCSNPLSYEAITRSGFPKRALIISHENGQFATRDFTGCVLRKKAVAENKLRLRPSCAPQTNGRVLCRGRRSRATIGQYVSAQHLAIQPVMVEGSFADTHRNNIDMFDQADVPAKLTRRVPVGETG